jgi:predicted RNase H-like HicB family nuclease
MVVAAEALRHRVPGVLDGALELVGGAHCAVAKLQNAVAAFVEFRQSRHDARGALGLSLGCRSEKLAMDKWWRPSILWRMTEIIFLVEEDLEGGFVAEAVGHGVFTQADTIDELHEMVRDAVRCHFEDEPDAPRMIRLHFVRDEVIAA